MERAKTPVANRTSSGSLRSTGTGEAAAAKMSSIGLKSFNKAGVQARPMTSSKGAGYISAGRVGTAGAGSKAGGPGTAQEQARQMEERVHTLLEQCADLRSQGDTASAVDAAKEAARKEQKLCSLLEGTGQADQVSLDLKFAVSLNLAGAFHANGQPQDALNTYTQIIKSRIFPQAGWLRLNMGNIQMEQEQYALAVKMYRMALDQLPPALKRMRLNVQRNIGIAFLRAGRFQDAYDTFASIMTDGPDHQTAFNLALCCWTMRDVELMKQAFLQLIQIPPYLDDSANDSEEDLALENDPLQLELRQRQQEVDRYILVVARLVGPLLDPADLSVGYDWCRQQLVQANYPQLGNEVQLAKAWAYLGRKEYHTAIGILKDFERADSRTRAQAAINLSTLHLLEGEVETAAGYADFCLGVEPENPAALISRGNVHLAAGQAEAALQLYEDALQADALSVQALYNVGLACKQLGLPDRALEVLHALLQQAPQHAEAMLLLADLYDELGDVTKACEWFVRLTSRAAHDSGALCRHGGLLARLGEEGEAVQYHLEAHRVDPTNLDTISWLGAHYVRQQDYAAAIPYFQAAASVQPKEVKWALMVAGCLRRVGQLEEALYRYRAVYATHPTNMECLRYLVQLSQEFGLKDDAQKFSTEMQRAERLAAVAAASGTTPSTPGRPGGRVTVPGYRPSTGATLALLGGRGGGGLTSPFKSTAGLPARQLQGAGAAVPGGGGRRVTAGLTDFQVTGGRPPTAVLPSD